MPLELKLEQSSITSNGDRMYISNTADYTNVDEDGNGVPDRDETAFILLVNNKRTDGDVPLSITSYDPVTVSQWEVFLNKDGWQECRLYILRVLSTSKQLDLNEIVWDSANQKIVRILTKSGSDPYTYTTEDVEDSELIDETDNLYQHTIFNTYTLFNLCNLHYRANQRGLTMEGEDWEEYQEIDAVMNSIKYAFCFSQFTEAQKQVESLEPKIPCYEDLEVA